MVGGDLLGQPRTRWTTLKGYFKVGSKGFHLLRNEDVETHTGQWNAEWHQIVEWRTSVRPPMARADLRQLNENPDTVWRDLTTDEPEARLANLVGVVVGAALPGK